MSAKRLQMGFELIPTGNTNQRSRLGQSLNAGWVALDYSAIAVLISQ